MKMAHQFSTTKESRQTVQFPLPTFADSTESSDNVAMNELLVALAVLVCGVVAMPSTGRDPCANISDIELVNKHAWAIISNSEVVPDPEGTNWAGAIPRGLNPQDLAGFKAHGIDGFGWVLKGAQAQNELHFKWKFGLQCAGSYQGHGAFLMGAGIVITDYKPLWGYNVNATTSVEVYNFGTATDPVAGLLFHVDLTVRTLLQSVTKTCHVMVYGTCQYKVIQC